MLEIQFLVLEIRFLVLEIRFLVLQIQFLTLEIEFLVLGIRFLVLEIEFLAGIRNPGGDAATRCLTSGIYPLMARRVPFLERHSHLDFEDCSFAHER